MQLKRVLFGGNFDPPNPIFPSKSTNRCIGTRADDKSQKMWQDEIQLDNIVQEINNKVNV